MSKNQRYSLNKNKYLLDSEFERLQSILKSYLFTDHRNCVLIHLALNTGGRAQEILNLTNSDLNEGDRSLLIKGIKGSNDREIPLPDWLFDEVKALESIEKKSQTSEQALFPISYQRLVQIWLHYRPVHKSFHSLRHTFAIRLYKKTRDIRLVQVALGHRNITNTMIYADYVYSQEELRKLII